MLLMTSLVLLSFAMTPFAFVPRTLVQNVLTRSSPCRSFGKRMRRRPAALNGDGGPVRVRFAPSPTGSLHIGGARTALFNWLKVNAVSVFYVFNFYSFLWLYI
jgi:hypothetical protein